MSTNVDALRPTTQAWRLDVELREPRYFRLADVGPEGTDDGDIHTYPPESDLDAPFGGALDFTHARAIGTLEGTVQGGGMSGQLTIQDAPATAPDFVGVELWLSSWHGGIPGVVGAAGIADRARIFRGYASRATTSERFPTTEVKFTLEGSQQFSQRSSFSRGIDWAPGLGHSAPVSFNAIMDHLVRYHTNIPSRSEFGIYLDDHELNKFSLSGGSLHELLKACTRNAIEGWVYWDREDNLQVRAHPNLAPESWAAELAAPIIHLDDDLLLGIDVGEQNTRQVASIGLTATKSDETEMTVIRYADGGLGSRDVRSDLRFDDEVALQRLAELYMNHANRRYNNVQVDLPLIAAVDLGNIVQLTYRNEYRGINWVAKPFVTTGLRYDIDADAQTFKSHLILDEVVV